ncbi:hypothetical protein SPAB_03404 [Salmonella enterica subsp. enterica serovar Paratyphi B str. SPB7]|uniref:Uncharacterized protein n=1 Tax=Salmonella paratyphi B (strain ATCC BAA-1250 / SPB7) TaxID=1016998 RepID=A0A6C6Z4V1_SALPB|nr:hypothetical protein SPAB_03404 [Salmonella enterica subsp. enterica serovar Paratyphi B str. SPB7]
MLLGYKNFLNKEYILVVVWYLLLLISVRHREYIFEA